MKTPHFHSLLLLLLVATAAATSIPVPQPQPQPQPRSPLGGYAPITNLTDPHVIEVAKFAVKEHNKQVDKSHALKFMRVLMGWSQVVAGVNYRIVISTRQVHERVNHRYLAVVYERPWEHFMNLTSFKQV